MGILDNLLGGGVNAEVLTKKDISNVNQVTNQTTDTKNLTYSPVIDTSYNININSAGATATTKKDSTATPSVSVIPTSTASESTEKTSGGDSLIGGSSGTLLIVGAIGLGGLFLFSKFGGKK